MIDFLTMLFAAIKYSVFALTKPSPDLTTRQLECVILATSALGITLFVCGVIHAIMFNLAGALWFWLVIIGMGLCGVAGCTGVMIEKRNESKEDSP